LKGALNQKFISTKAFGCFIWLRSNHLGDGVYCYYIEKTGRNAIIEWWNNAKRKDRDAVDGLYSLYLEL
jgi:hypothetical protein